MWVFNYVLDFPLEGVDWSGMNTCGHDRMQVMPFSISCTESEEECWASYLCDHVSQLRSAFVPERPCSS